MRTKSTKQLQFNRYFYLYGACGTVRKSAGFTLIEVMVAVSVFALISVASFAAINNVLTAREIIEDKQANLLSLQRTHAFLKNDIRYAVKRGIRDEFGEVQPPMLIDSGGNLLNLTTLYPDQNNVGKLKRVVWRLEDDNLWRDEYLVLDRSFAADRNSRLILEDIEEITIHHYAVQDGQVQRSANWDSNEDIPLAIEIDLLFSSKKRYLWRFGSSQL